MSRSFRLTIGFVLAMCCIAMFQLIPIGHAAQGESYPAVLAPNDGGVIFVPPGKFPAVQITSGFDVANTTIIARDTQPIRCGPINVRSSPTSKMNGIRICNGCVEGTSLVWPAANGLLYCVAEERTPASDAGVVIDVVFGGKGYPR